jgi:nitroimidazol reductase NimA-like FMN-containing flavoprotein (pyridoxamine 5'-phosphate oxidase superfamily)
VSDVLAPTERTTVRRLRQRAVYQRAVVNQILDEALVCQVGFVVDGQPFVLPTIHARVGEVLYLHGARANRMLRTLSEGLEACVSVTIVDGLVLARSAFHHSVNYRSVTLFGRATEVVETDEKQLALAALVEHVAPGRSADARRPNDVELQATLMIRLPIVEASAKVRTGPPIDDAEDLGLPAWAGVLPFRTVTEAPVAAPDLAGSPAVPGYLSAYPDWRR